MTTRLNVSRSPVHECIVCPAETEKYSPWPRSTRPKVTSKQTDSMIQRLAKTIPTISDAAIESQWPPGNAPSTRPFSCQTT